MHVQNGRSRGILIHDMDQGKAVLQVSDVQKSIVSIEDPRLFHEAFRGVCDFSLPFLSKHAASLVAAIMTSESKSRPKPRYLVIEKGEPASHGRHVLHLLLRTE